MILLKPDPAAERRRWLTSDPFPHVVLSNCIYPEEAAGIAAEFPDLADPRWKTYSGPLEHGKQEGDASIAGPLVADVHDYLASDEFVDWLRRVSGIPDLTADPTRLGGGIHQCGLGGLLGMHVDFNVHPDRPDLVRAVNVILFVGNRDDLWRYEERHGIIENVYGWRPAWGGYLSLGTRGPGPDVMPEPGTLVVFEASDTSWHGHPVPMQPDPTTGHEPPVRRSIPAYYYRPVRPDETVEAHSTRFYDVESGNCPHKRSLLNITIVHGRCTLCGGTVR